MPNSLQSSAIASPASRRATNCILSSIAEHSLQGIASSPKGRKCYPCDDSITMCHPCVRSLIKQLVGFGRSLICTLIAQYFEPFHRFERTFGHVFDVVTLGRPDAGMTQKPLDDPESFAESPERVSCPYVQVISSLHCPLRFAREQPPADSLNESSLQSDPESNLMGELCTL